jgi:gliding motility-associated lipoprotein GldD
MKQAIKSMLPILVLLTFFACKENYVPKPRDYIKISYPEKSYQHFNSDAPFRFDYPVYARMSPDSSPNSQPYWYNLEFPSLGGTLYLSYKPVEGSPESFIQDSRSLVYKHSIKAEAIDESIIHDSGRRVFGILYDLKGNTASSVQFFVTDSTRHFLRGSLYFNSQPDKDSMAPVIRFVREDIIVMLKTLEWNP